MYYHKSPITGLIRRVKQARAVEMKAHTDAMKATSARFAGVLDELERFRAAELDAEVAILNRRLSGDQARAVDRRINSRRKRLVKKIDAFLTDIK